MKKMLFLPRSMKIHKIYINIIYIIVHQSHYMLHIYRLSRYNPLRWRSCFISKCTTLQGNAKHCDCSRSWCSEESPSTVAWLGAKSPLVHDFACLLVDLYSRTNKQKYFFHIITITITWALLLLIVKINS